MESLINMVILLFLLTLGYFSGRILESRHYKSIEAREHDLLPLPAVTLKNALDPTRDIRSAQLVAGNAVISVDYFKRFLSGLRNIFGGRVTAYETLVDRARREAILRMKAEAPKADIILNMRVQTSSISKGKKDAVGTVEALAYGTAIRYVPGAAQKPRTEKIRPDPQPESAAPSQPDITASSSAETRYNLMFTGEIAAGQDLSIVKANVAQLYKVPVEKCEHLFRGSPVKIKGDLDRETAQKYKKAFEQTGAVCRIEEM